MLFVHDPLWERAITQDCVFRPALEPSQDEATLTDYEARRLLNAIIKEFVQMTAEDLDQQETEENR